MRYRTRKKLDMYAFGGVMAAVAVGLWWFLVTFV